MVIVFSIAAVVSNSCPVFVSMIFDSSDMRMFGVPENPVTVRCHVTGVGVASTNDNADFSSEPRVSFYMLSERLFCMFISIANLN